MDRDTTRNAQLVALAGTVTPKVVKAAKEALPQGCTVNVDFTAKIRGVVQKGHDEPATTVQVTPTLNLFDRVIMAELLRRLKTDPAMLRRCLRAAGKKYAHGGIEVGKEQQQFLDIFEQLSEEIANSLPQEPKNTPGKTGAVRPSCTYEIT